MQLECCDADAMASIVKALETPWTPSRALAAASSSASMRKVNSSFGTTFSSSIASHELVQNPVTTLFGLSHQGIESQTSLTMPATTAETLSIVNRTVSVAPLVLLSAADHYGRTARGTRKRVVGVLLGQNDGKSVRVSNSFAVPFEEDEKDPSVWFLDHNYVESMNDMFKKVNAREKLIGWYHSGPKLRASDLEINELFKRYTPNPLLVIIDVQPKDVGVPTDAYFAVEEIKDDGTTTTKTFMHTPSTIEAEEAEEIGVEHLLRDIRDVAVGTLSTRITSQLQSLQGLHLRLQDISKYLQKVIDHELPVNHAILGNLQDVFNLLPNLSTPKLAAKDLAAINGLVNGGVGVSGGGGGGENTELSKAMSIKTNDQLMSIYLSSLIRAITAFHDLIENKIQNKRMHEDEDARDGEEKAEKEGRKEDKPGANGTGEKPDKEGKEHEPAKKAEEKGKKKG
nr:26s proteasome regulatory subunit rpn-8 [Quercus suber]